MNSMLKKATKFVFSKRGFMYTAITLSVSIYLIRPIHIDFGQKVWNVRIDKWKNTTLISLDEGGYMWKGNKIEFVLGCFIPFNSWQGPPGRSYYSNTYHVFELNSSGAREVITDNYLGSVEFIVKNGYIYRLSRYEEVGSKALFVQKWDGTRFINSDPLTNWRRFLEDKTALTTLETWPKGQVSFTHRGQRITVKEVPDSRKVEVHFPDKVEVLFKGKEKGFTSKEEFWRRLAPPNSRD